GHVLGGGAAAADVGEGRGGQRGGGERRVVAVGAGAVRVGLLGDAGAGGERGAECDVAAGLGRSGVGRGGGGGQGGQPERGRGGDRQGGGAQRAPGPGAMARGGGGGGQRSGSGHAETSR